MWTGQGLDMRGRNGTKLAGWGRDGDYFHRHVGLECVK